MKLLRTFSLSYRLILLIGIFTLGFGAYGAWSFRTLDQLKVNGPLYREIVASKDIIADTLPPPLYIIESYLVVLKLKDAQASARPLLEQRLRTLRAEFDQRLAYWEKQPLTPQRVALMEAASKPAEQFYQMAFTRLLPALQAAETPGIGAALADMAAAYEQHRKAVDVLVSHAGRDALASEAAAAARIDDGIRTQLLILLAALGLAIGVAVLIRRSITAPLDEALALARRVAAGDMRPFNHARFGDEPGRLLDALDEMSARLAATLDERTVAALSARIARDLTDKLIATANVLIVGLDKRGQVVIFNDTASRVTGYAPAHVLGQVWADLALVGAANKAHWPRADGWDAVRLVDEHEITTADGQRRMIAWQNTVLGDEGGEVALMAFGIDVSEQRAAFEAMRRAQTLAEAATESKSQFLANMSHEIRTPMNAVIGMTRLALDTDLDARQRNYLEKADRAAHGLLGIINDILDFSKIEAGKLHFEERPMLLGDTLDHLASMTVFKAQEKGLELLFDIAPDVPLDMVGDPLRLGQILLNLVNNAIKFTERGEIIVAVRLLETGLDDIGLQFEVRDTGIGISAAQSERLFASFAQADASTTRVHGGTGLGLSISRRLVEMMDGRLWVESVEGCGSRFLFTAQFGRSRGEAQGRPDSHELDALRVLVVDDNAAAREIMQGILASMRMQSTVCVGAAEAIAELERAQAAGEGYQLVLMDWIMPSMDGLAAIRAIRANPAISETLSIIMVTAYSRDDLMAKAGDVERLGVLDKPVTPSTVLDAIMRAMRSSGIPSTRAEAPRRRMAGALKTLRGASVLLVEDNEVNQELAVDVLSGLGLQVSVASHGKMALEMIANGAFDAVLMDCQMPVMDGFEATRQIRLQARFASLPILAMTANAMSGDRERCLEAGMNDHISKPINRESLALSLARALAPVMQARAQAAPSQQAVQAVALRRAGVDVAAGLARLHGSDIAYTKLMQQVLDLHASFEAQVQAALAGGAPERARRIAHNLHGMALNLGAAQLAAAAGLLERGIADGADIASLLAAVAPPYAIVRAALQDEMGGA